MHREFDATDSPFRPRSNLTLYLFTAFLGALLVADLWPPFANWLTTQGLTTPTWASREFAKFRFALFAAVFGGARVLFTSLERLTEGKVGADLAVAIACVAAILIGEPLVAAEVVFIGLVGECLEAITFDRTQRALTQLTELFPVRCWVLRDGEEVRTLTTDLQVGDRIVIKPGGRIPADGVVCAGQSDVDTSALTGESLPRPKIVGDAVLAGSIVLAGSLTVEAKKVAKQTVAGQVIELTAAALKQKSPGERLADRLARYFLPAVLAVAVLTFAANVFYHVGPFAPEGKKISFAAASRLALYPTLAVLVVACPCPLVLATPAAVIAALGRLAGTGVLIKGGAVLERLATVTGFAFDKTGTLTEGQLELGDVFPHEGVAIEELLQVAATAEVRSEHPIARLIVNEARRRNLTWPEPEQFQAIPGSGVTANQGEHAIHVGTRRYLGELGIPVPNETEEQLKQLDSMGQTALLVVRDGMVLGVIGARDRLRPEAAGALAGLQELGITRLLLLTGDRAAAAQAMAAPLPLTEIRSELLPTQKAEALTDSMAFVGDGVNDAPALARASVGIAIGSGTEIAAEAGDIIMMGDPLRPLPLLVRLSREMVQVIRQNVVWFGFGVNIVGVILTGWLWPIFATSPDWYEKAPLAGVLYHQLGSLAVLLNSMRLLAFERAATGRTANSLRAGYRTFDRWMNTVHLDDVLHEVLHRWKPISAALVALGLLLWLASGLVQIEAKEVGVVQRFGALRTNLNPGLHFRWPWPIETVVRVTPGEIRTVEIGFRLLTEADARRLERAKLEQQKLRRPGRELTEEPGQTWASAHAEGIARMTDESLMITGDGDLIELLATLRYTISDPARFLLGSRDPDAILRSVMESVFRELSAGRPFQHLLGAGRTTFETAAQVKLNERLREAVPEGLGIQIEGLTVHDLHPPQDVVVAYYAVADAIQKRDKAINDANAEATRVTGRATEEALRTVRQAEADSQKKIAEATAARDVIAAWQQARSTLPAAAEEQLKAEQSQRLKAGEDPAAVQKAIDEKRRLALATRRFLTDFRLSLEATTSVLRSRDKILIDSEKAAGTRKLFLFDPDLLPRIPPVAFPRGGALDPRDP
jgi:Cu+-exporting ATPase